MNSWYLLWLLEAGWWYRKTLALLLAQWVAICSVGQMMNRSLQTQTNIRWRVSQWSRHLLTAVVNVLPAAASCFLAENVLGDHLNPSSCFLIWRFGLLKRVSEFFLVCLIHLCVSDSNHHF